MTLWALHIAGSDDYIAMSSEQEARARKATCDRFDSEREPIDPVFAAEVVEWPYPPEAHAKQLREAESSGR